MSTYSVTYVKQFVDCVVNEHLKPYILNCQAIEQVESWMEDNASKEQYRRELAFLALENILKNEQVVMNYAGNLHPETLRQAEELAESLGAAGKLPELCCPQEFAMNKYAMCVSAFILGQYAYGDLVRPRDGGVFLDCGALYGDTAIWAVWMGAGRVYSFEPNPEAMPYLVANTANHGRGRIVTLPFGVGASNSRMSLSINPSSPGSTRVIDAGGEGDVQIVALDDWCVENDVKPDFIKMDIEGSEIDAIKGAAKTIMTRRPDLAICLYHYLSDMWEIPVVLKTLVPEYKFWCRKNYPNRYEFVLYASVGKQ
jgi:FkbM family methyltransferase